MKKIIWLALFVLSVLLSYGQSFTMQSTNAGFSLQVGGGVSSWQTINSEENASNGTDISITAGYGFDENFEVLFSASISMFPNKKSTDLNILDGIEHDPFVVAEAFNLVEGRIGAKYNFGSTLGPLRINASAQMTYFSGNQEVLDWDYFNFRTVEIEGLGFTVGAGIKYHLKLPIALTLDINGTYGQYEQYIPDLDRYEGAKFRIYRANVGVVAYFNQF